MLEYKKEIRHTIAMIRAWVGPFQLKESRKKKELKRNALFEGKKKQKKKREKKVKASKNPGFFFFSSSPSITVRMFMLNTCIDKQYNIQVIFSLPCQDD